DEKTVTTDWSSVRSFEVGPDSVPFPCPTNEELAAKIPEGHPRLMFRQSDLPHLREVGNTKMPNRWKDVIDQANKRLENPPDTTEPPMYPEGIEIKGDEWKEIWWGNRGRVIAVADGAATLAFAYNLTGEEKYGKAARDLIMAMTEWNTDGSTNYRYNDEAAMPAMYMTSRAYTWAYPFFSEEDRKAVTQMMFERGRDCYDHLRSRRHLWNPYASHSNRAWHFLGEIAVTFYGEFPEAEEWLEYAMTVLYCAYPVWSDSDGGWHEGTAYWSSYIRRFLQWTLTLDAIFDIDIFQRPFFNKTGDFGMYVMPPGSKSGGFGDQGGHFTAKSLAPFMDLLGASAKNPYWLWYAEANDAEMEWGYLGYLFSAKSASVEPKAPTDLPDSAVFRGVGVAALNTNLLDGTDNHQVLFKSSPKGRQSHGYNANNSFLLNLDGEKVLVRSGRRDIHGSPHHTEWMWNSKADNSILVNGEGQIRHSPDATGEIVAFQTSDNVDVVVGEAAASYRDLDRFTRRIVFLKPDAVLIHDILEAATPSTFQYNLHSVGPFEIGDNSLKWTGDPGSLSVNFLEPAGLVLDQTDEYDVPPHEWAHFNLNEWHMTADAQEKVKHREFLSLIVINGAEGKVEMERGREGKKVSITLPGSKFDLRLGDQDFSVSGGGIDWEF
ncbi:MAG: DUF4962 domain-containing protein, partial [Candidatus Omnitrophica bacterium]|nr:DUF4962 domain-containing protein [Candidatus Omnitrophota bacterium]